MCFNSIPGMVSSCFDSHNLAIVFLLYSSSFPNLPKILSGHLSLIRFRFLLSLAKLFLNFIVCIFNTVTGYILIVGGSSPEIELISVIVI